MIKLYKIKSLQVFNGAEVTAYLRKTMRKLFDTKAGATFYQELPNTTICMKKESMELIFKMEPGLYAIIHLIRVGEGELLLLAEWGNYFDMLTNPNVQIPQIKRTCPTLYKVLVGKDEDR